MDKQAIKIASEKSNKFILAFENITSNTNVYDTEKNQILMLESPNSICAIIPKKTCASGHKINLYIIQSSQVPKGQLSDITKLSNVIKLSSEVVEIEEYGPEENKVVFRLLEDNMKEHKKIEAVILERQERFNELLNQYRNTHEE
ncbi:hypothetical protein ABMA70_04205 [Halobacteriovorax sp. XZX-3]|uniref:hypothetical protein n=1 Tax=unclassified Halobacteriovorax TaxID=2639665 RepID=UPI000CD08F24|nr:hypothetical protein [Halobacteriovorax sp. DA5]POB15290.1 hypothetical protein C0Z22_02575 [Halobacteriovorax sp. DA5]